MLKPASTSARPTCVRLTLYPPHPQPFIPQSSIEDLAARLASPASPSSSSCSSLHPPSFHTPSSHEPCSTSSPAPTSLADHVARLRPNLVVGGFPPYAEDTWRHVVVGQLAAGVLGTCPRCELLQVGPLATAFS